MGWRRQEHLAQIVEEHGSPALTKAIVGLIEEGLAARNKKERAERDEAKKGQPRNPYITDAGKCPRQIFFRLTGVEETEPLTTDSLANFGIGHAIEEWIAGILEDADIDIVREIYVRIEGDNGTIISGRADFFVSIALRMSSGEVEHFLLELKSVNSRGMGWMIKRHEEGKDDHRRQLRLYLDASRQGLLDINPDCVACEGKGRVVQESNGRRRHRICRLCRPFFKTGVLLYVVKDPTKGEPVLHAYEVPYDSELAEGDKEFLSLIDSMAKEGTDPGRPKEYEKNKFPCSYCSFKTFCWSS